VAGTSSPGKRMANMESLNGGKRGRNEIRVRDTDREIQNDSGAKIEKERG
jgi:hypothetical protein